MSRWPFLISVPHGGLAVPPEVADLCVLTPRQIEQDGDEGAAEIYAGLEARAQAFVTTRIARAIVDLNRAEDDRRTDGVVKTHTCHDVEVYRPFPGEDVVRRLIDRYWRPYHTRLTAIAGQGQVRLGIDCHTMLEIGPPAGPLAGKRRPEICLSNVDGASCPPAWFDRLAECLEEAFGHAPARNDPFKGGYITRNHSAEIPWVQIELSRSATFSRAEKAARIEAALDRFARSTAW